MKSCEIAKEMFELMERMTNELQRWCEKGRKVAAKNVRKDSIQFEKIAKLFRKQSVQDSKTK